MSDRPSPWFSSTTGLTLTSHNGWDGSGTLEAFRRAYERGYRWMQVDAVPIKGDLISDHSIFGRKFGYLKKDLDDIRTKRPQVASLEEVLSDPQLEGVRWNIELKSK